jgi:hypothetical protein
MTHATPDTAIRHDTLARVTGRSGRGTARQTVRIPEDLWDELGTVAPENVSRSEVIRAFIEWYVRRPGAKLPKRPDTPPAGE